MNVLRQRLLTILSLLLLSPCPAWAEVNGSIELGPAVANGSAYEIEVTLDFSSDDGEETVFFALNASATDDILTSGGSDYGRFCV